MARKSSFIATAALRSQRWPGTPAALCSLSRQKTAKRVSWSSEATLGSRERCLAAPVNAHEPSVGENDVVERPKTPDRIFLRFRHAGGGIDVDRLLSGFCRTHRRSARAGDATLARLACCCGQR